MTSGHAKISYEEIDFSEVAELKAAKDHFDCLFGGKLGFQGSKAETGEPYVVIVPGGFKEEGGQYPFWCTSVDIAVTYWKVAVHNYAPENGTLYWRSMPSLCICSIQNQWETMKLYTVYSRLLISSAPEVKAA